MSSYLVWPSYFRKTGITLCFLALMALSFGAFALAEDRGMASEDVVVHRARTAWLDGSSMRALDILDQRLRENPHILSFQKLRGDILTTIRRHPEALDAYETVLQGKPESLEVRWARWSVLTRIGKGDLAIAELQGLAQRDANNPLVHLRLAQELRKFDRLEESLESYRKAVELAPEFPGWRLSMARARFDILDYAGARDEVQTVLQIVPPDSPEEASARSLLSIVYGATKERGRRFQPILSPEGTAAERKHWAFIREKAWRLFSTGRYREAEPALREVLSLKPSDFHATYELGCTVMELGRYEEAITLLQKGIELNPPSGDVSEVFLDSLFRIGQSFAALEQWPEALLHFELLQQIATVPQAPAEATQTSSGKPAAIPAKPPVTASGKTLDMEKLAYWLEKTWQHVPRPKEPAVDFNKTIPAPAPSNPAPTFNKELGLKKMKPDEPIHTRASLMGRDADFSWFRFVIPSDKVMRDDLNTGTHEFIPIDPSDTFPVTQKDIHLVFALITASYDEVPLTTVCFPETSQIASDQNAVAQDQVVMSMNEQSGYFILSPPELGWAPGLYQCGLFAGEEVSAYTLADEVRFRIVGPNQTS